MSNYDNKEQLIKDTKAAIDILANTGILRDECKEIIKSLFLEAFEELGVNFDNVAGNYMRRNIKKYNILTPEEIDAMDLPDAEMSPERFQLETFVFEGCDEPSDAALLAEYAENHPGFNPNHYEFFDRKKFVRKYDGSTGYLLRCIYRKKKVCFDNPQDVYDFVREQMQAINREPVERIPLPENPKLGVLQICDVHYGAFCTMAEHGIDWDAEKCVEDINYIVDQAIRRIKLEGINKVIVAMTGDGINSDTLDHTTAHGTQQYDCLSCDDLFKGYAKICINVINRLVKEAGVYVDFIHTVGNHDELTGTHLQSTLSLIFDDNPNVSIKDEKNFRKKRKFGRSLLVFSHGQQEGKRMIDTPAQEAPQEWGDVKYVYVITEHTHQFALVPNGRVQQLVGSTIAPPGTWTKRSAYVGARRGAAFHTFDKETCLTSTAYLDVKYDKIVSHVLDVEEIF